MDDDDHLDGRARFGLACALVSLLGLVYHPLAFFFAPLGAVFSLASLLSVDEPASPRTRRVALAGLAVAVAVFAIALAVVLSAPQSGE